MPLLRPNIQYHGIDIAIHDPAPNLIEADFLEVPIQFGDKHFDIILAQYYSRGLTLSGRPDGLSSNPAVVPGYVQ